MRFSSGRISAFVAGATIGLVAAEAVICATSPYMKRMMIRKGMRAIRAARAFGERLF